MSDKAEQARSMAEYEQVFFNGPRIGGRHGEPVYAAILPSFDDGHTFDEKRLEFHAQNLAAALGRSKTVGAKEQAVAYEARSERLGRTSTHKNFSQRLREILMGFYWR